jgi:hypothetical protein
MSDFIKILENNKEWVENALAVDPNYFVDWPKGKHHHYCGLVVQTVVFQQMKSSVLQVRFLYIEISLIWWSIQI